MRSALYGFANRLLYHFHDWTKRSFRYPGRPDMPLVRATQWDVRNGCDTLDVQLAAPDSRLAQRPRASIKDGSTRDHCQLTVRNNLRTLVHQERKELTSRQLPNTMLIVGHKY